MTNEQQKKFDQISALVGNTPLLEIRFSYCGKKRRVFAKAEWLNLTGSIKDRVALHILNEAYKDGSISVGDRIIEATSGNTGIAFSAIGRNLGHPVSIFMPNWMSKERVNLMQAFGAEVVLVSKEQGGFLGSIEMTEKLAQEPGIFLPCQFSNEQNTIAHELTTGQEIIAQLSKIGLMADAVVAGVGTGGTVMGIGNALKKANPHCKVHPLEPESSPTLSTGFKVGAHRIQGISDEFIPSLLHLNELDQVVSVGDEDSIIMARMLSEKLGIGVGISSGANFLGCVLAQNQIGDDAVVTTVFADDNKKYLSTDYSNDYTMLDCYLSSKIELDCVIAHPAN